MTTITAPIRISPEALEFIRSEQWVRESYPECLDRLLRELREYRDDDKSYITAKSEPRDTE